MLLRIVQRARAGVQKKIEDQLAPESLRQITKAMEGKMINEESHLRMGICKISNFKTHSFEKLNQDVRDLTEIFRMIKAAREDYKEWERMRFRTTYQSNKLGERLEPIEEKEEDFLKFAKEMVENGIVGDCGHVKITERDQPRQL
ncbi:hypothetical protein TWF569_005641 [Orbilia oligospora]|uniref:Uncharacterized protein n=1 Tax=Orbilia oligospora TaxID=2813651 RepID=A0A7C8J2Q3_ORBOL|nr:hypothetical protein TWF102_009494 [Orbilia oligospora]KAF3115856.1 hypothetical protein TWF706_005951 [Orbilia oligospora]KAF3118117.1 hypothetical protein TWF103_000148 [Orbilia oligospora]KAF3132685.1 hypothetical protein TWF594_009502 [Orbilia oligospora]KAF3134646.1 hypothetical protein TWF703_006303 [Orbilia oligospora]